MKSIHQKIIIGIYIVFVVLGFLFIRTNVLACAPDEVETGGVCVRDPAKKYNLLAPLPCSTPGTNGCSDQGELTSFDPTGEGGGALGGYLNLMIKLFIGICAVLAVIMIVIGGMEYMTSELISSKEHGKERITHAILGLLLALGAYTILFTINPALLDSDFKSLGDVTIEVDMNADVPQSYDPTTKKYPNGTTFGNKWDDSVAKITALPAGVSVYNSQCTTVGQANCTSTRGLSLNYINTILAKCSDCKPLSIQGGTESWLHGGKTGSTTHQLGSPTVDLAITPALTKYIKSGTKTSANRWTKDGISYLYEGNRNHWHAGP